MAETPTNGDGQSRRKRRWMQPRRPRSTALLHGAAIMVAYVLCSVTAYGFTGPVFFDEWTADEGVVFPYIAGFTIAFSGVALAVWLNTADWNRLRRLFLGVPPLLILLRLFFLL